MPKRYTEQERAEARLRYLQGDRPEEIAEHIGCTDRMVRIWAKKYKWDKELLNRKANPTALETMLSRVMEQEPTTENIKKIAMLSNALNKVNRNAPSPKAVSKAAVKKSISKDILELILSPEYGLYEYQKAFLQDDSRFIKMVKARQIGLSYCLALKAILQALAGREQLIVSASDFQAQRVLSYVSQHLDKLNIIPEKETDKVIVINGTAIWARPNNFRTIQGSSGDVILDEFAWFHNQKRIWEAILPSITTGGNVIICSTPFVPGNFFWELVTEHKGKWTNWAGYRITIHEAIEQGMPLPGGIDELKSLFDSDSWAMLYECQWAEDGSALLNWDMLHRLATGSETRIWSEPIYCGVDVGRTNDRFAVAKVGMVGDKYQLLHMDSEKNMPFSEQRSHLENVFRMYPVKRMNIDRTGIGMQLSEEVVQAHPGIAFGKYFNRPLKERLALNLLKLCEDDMLILPNDSALLAQLHSIKRKATATGITYDAERDNTGHADEVWALALAVEGLAKGYSGHTELEVWG